MEHATDPAYLIDRLEREVPGAALDALHRCRAYCAAGGLGLYLVGGAVRDLMLARPQIDLDLVLEGEVAPLAKALALETGGKAVLHDRFGTAHVSGPGFHLDLAQTRRESYTHPGALPSVERIASILDDLARRDFTINAIALRLTPPVELIDPFGGEADIKAGLVRVLHEDSFRDDATRMLRAIRYVARLNLRVEALTEVWLQRDLDFIGAISGPRLRRELSIIFGEPAAPQALLHAAHLGILGAIEPRLHLEREAAAAWDAALRGERFSPLDELGFCLISDPTTHEDAAAVSARLHLLGRVEAALRDLVRLRGLSGKLAATSDSPAEVTEVLDGANNAAVWALSILDRSMVGEVCNEYLSRWRHVQPVLTGRDLIALGAMAGREMGAMLRRLRRARLRGEATSRADEERLVREMLAADQGE